MTGRLLFFILCLTCFAFPIKSLEAKKGVRELIKDREKVPKKHGTPFPCHPKHLALINPHYEGGCTGMFSVFNYVIGCLDLFENGEFTGITLNFGEMGLYYEKKRGRTGGTIIASPFLLEALPSVRLVISGVKLQKLSTIQNVV